MKNILFFPFVAFYLLAPPELWARSIVSTATKLGREVTQLGFAVAVVGFAVGCIYLILGKQDASAKLTQTFFGVLLLAMSPAIIKLVKSVGA